MDFYVISPFKIALSSTGSGNHVTFLFIFGISLNIKEIIVDLYVVQKSQRSSDPPIT